MEEQAAPAVQRGNLSRLLEKVRDRRGLDLGQYRPRYLERRLNVRLNALGIKTYLQYGHYLDAHPDEYAMLLDALTINVTQFYRDPHVFETFYGSVVLPLLQDKAVHGRKVVRAWSAGCATGEETYSVMGMLLKGAAELGVSDLTMHVTGTDIDRKALAVARKGTYPASRLHEIPLADRERLVEVDGGRFSIRPEVSRHVTFRYINLFEKPPIHLSDIVFCRNVFIYFNRPEQERMLDAFHAGLLMGGYLVLGRSERLAPAIADCFEAVSATDRIYRKIA